MRRRIKVHWNYTVDEAARALSVSKGTVRRWIKAGLPALADQRPVLLLGTDLLDFFKARSTPKQKCQQNECYCVKCRAPRSPAEGIAEFVPLTSTSGNLRALCPECTSLMHKRIGIIALDALERILDVKRLPAEAPRHDSRPKGTKSSVGNEAYALVSRRITDIPSPSLNDHFTQERENDA